MVIQIKVLPRSSKNGVVLRSGKLTVMVTSPPEGGKANSAALEVLAKWLAVGSSQLSLVMGKSARTKLVRVPDEFEPVLRERLRELESRL